MFHSRAIVPRAQLRKEQRYATAQAVARLHQAMAGHGRATASPASAPPWHPRVWVDLHDPQAAVVQAAAEGKVVSKAELLAMLGQTGNGTLPIVALSRLGIVAVPAGQDQFELKGTSRALSHIANRAYHARHRRQLWPRQLVAAYKGRKPNGKATRAGRLSLENAVGFMFERFRLDLSDLYYGKPIRL